MAAKQVLQTVLTGGDIMGIRGRSKVCHSKTYHLPKGRAFHESLVARLTSAPEHALLFIFIFYFLYFFIDMCRLPISSRDIKSLLAAQMKTGNSKQADSPMDQARCSAALGEVDGAAAVAHPVEACLVSLACTRQVGTMKKLKKTQSQIEIEVH